MSEETKPEEIQEVKQPDLPLDPEIKAWNDLQQDYLRTCAQAGEAQYVIARKRKELVKLNFQIKKMDIKGKALMTSLNAKAEAKKTKLTVVPDPIPEA